MPTSAPAPCGRTTIWSMDAPPVGTPPLGIVPPTLISALILAPGLVSGYTSHSVVVEALAMTGKWNGSPCDGRLTVLDTWPRICGELSDTVPPGDTTPSKFAWAGVIFASPSLSCT